MKNDFREYYDENYIIHSAWSANVHKYIKRLRGKAGKWKYIYKDVKKSADGKIAEVKRDVDYGIRNLGSKITGKNKTFEKKVFMKITHPLKTEYEKAQRESRKGLAKYQKRVNDPILVNEREQRESREGLKKYNRRKHVERRANKYKGPSNTLNKVKPRSKRNSGNKVKRLYNKITRG